MRTNTNILNKDGISITGFSLSQAPKCLSTVLCQSCTYLKLWYFVFHEFLALIFKMYVAIKCYLS